MNFVSMCVLAFPGWPSIKKFFTSQTVQYMKAKFVHVYFSISMNTLHTPYSTIPSNTENKLYGLAPTQ